MIEQLGVNMEDLEEEYTPDIGHFNALENLSDMPELYELSENFDFAGFREWLDYLDSWLSYLSDKRVEINSVQAAIENERLWEYIFEELDYTFTHRNYNRAITVPKYVLPDIYNQFFSFLIDKIREIQRVRREEIMEDLSNVEGFLNVEHKEQEIYEDLLDVLNAVEETNNQTSEQILKDLVSEFFNLDHNKYDE